MGFIGGVVVAHQHGGTLILFCTENPTQVIYGRVAGVAQGASWTATVADDGSSDLLTIPASGQAVSYGVST
ncbi:MAG: DUF3370 family protein [Cyanobacteria bacterium J06636_28]